MKNRLVKMLSVTMTVMLAVSGVGITNAVSTSGLAGNSGTGTNLELSSVSYKTVTEGFDWGPAITKVVLDMGTAIDSTTLSTATFNVSSERKYTGLDFKTMKPEEKDEIVKRTVVEAYASDAEGNKAAKGTYIAIRMEVAPDLTAGSPFNYDMASGQNKYVDTSYIISLADGAQLKTADGRIVKMAATDKTGYKGNSNLLADKFDRTGSYTNGKITLKYASFTPKTVAKKNGANPLIIWLHGAGEGGVDPAIALLGNKVVNLATDKIQSYFGKTGAYILAPQSPTMWMDYDGSGKYTNTVEGSDGSSYYTKTLKGLIDEYVKKHPEIDKKRIYIGGCSNGGYMTMNMIITYPDYFAAAYPVCEAYSNKWLTNSKLAKIKNIPIWFTHAKTDGTVAIYKGTTDMTTYTYKLTLDAKGKAIALDESSNAAYKRLVAAGSKNVHYSLWDKVVDTSGKYFKAGTKEPYEYMGHWSWIYTLNNQCTDKIGGKKITIFEWLAKQSK